MIYIVPSELRDTSNLRRFILDVDYTPCAGLEHLTGADIMISPDNLPPPATDQLILAHIHNGAILIQLKFGHDLSSSIVDGRLNEALARMIATGAHTWQRRLLFIGMLGFDNNKALATINGQLTYGQALTWKAVDQALGYWIDRGGALEFPLVSGKQLPIRLANIQKRINSYKEGKRIKLIFPSKERFYQEVPSNHPQLAEWGIGQKLVVVEDIRPLLCAIPKAKIGPEKATAILAYMEENNIKQNWYGFMSLLESGNLIKVPGIGKGTLEAICQGLNEERIKQDE